MTASGLSDAERTKLAKILGLLGSDFAGERDGAALAAARFLRERGLTFADVAAALAAPQPPPWRTRAPRQPPPQSPPQPPPPSAWRETVEAALRHGAQLTRWELQFLLGLRARAVLTEKQAVVLRALAARLGVS